jgi:hypothetical protein
MNHQDARWLATLIISLCLMMMLFAVEMVVLDSHVDKVLGIAQTILSTCR